MHTAQSHLVKLAGCNGFEEVADSLPRKLDQAAGVKEPIEVFVEEVGPQKAAEIAVEEKEAKIAKDMIAKAKKLFSRDSLENLCSLIAEEDSHGYLIEKTLLWIRSGDVSSEVIEKLIRASFESEAAPYLIIINSAYRFDLSDEVIREIGSALLEEGNPDDCQTFLNVVDDSEEYNLDDSRLKEKLFRTANQGDFQPSER